MRGQKIILNYANLEKNIKGKNGQGVKEKSHPRR